MEKVYVIHENPEWISPLADALNDLEIPWAEWSPLEGVVAFEESPPNGVFYNRVGASSYLRGNRYAPENTDTILRWLDENGRRVINGVEALHLEINKIAQYFAFKKAGIRTPRTTAVAGDENLIKAAEQLGKAPFILKPNRGGMGAGVKKFYDVEEVRAFLTDASQPRPVDGVWLLQEYIENPEGYITRCEFVDGKFLYAMRVDTRDGFELCPAGQCSLENRRTASGAGYEKFTILRGFRNDFLIRAYQQFLVNNRIDTAGIEFVTDRYGNHYTYDVNVNTNYNQSAELAAGIKLTGMKAIANFLADNLYSSRFLQHYINHPARMCG